LRPTTPISPTGNLRMTDKPTGDESATTKVAVVEDNDTVRQFLTELIANTPGHQCVCACASAEEAVERIPGLRPHVVLMDIQLPGESGVVCTGRLRELMPEIQVIMLTVYRDTNMIFQALRAGACGYVLKRADDREILEAIAEVRAGGAPMTSQVARMVVRSFQEEASHLSEAQNLSHREKEILALVAQGRSNKEIGSQLNITSGTVRIHLSHIYEKLHVCCRTEAAAKYFNAKLSERV